MICPHCKKPIDRGIQSSDIKRMFELRKLGYSLRDIAMLLENRVSFSSVCRLLKKNDIPAPKKRGVK
jgi:hypothetical protein